MRTHTPTLPLLAAGLVCSAAMVVVAGVLGGSRADALTQWTQALPEALAALACLATARHVHGRARWTWGLFATGLGIWAVTDLAYGVAVLAGAEIPEVSVLDAGWIAFYLPMLAGVGLLYGRLRPEPGWQGPLDAAIVGLTVALAAWIALLGPAADDAAGGTSGAVVALVYPAADLTALGCLVWLVFRHRRSSPTWLRWVVGAFALQVAGGILYLFAGQHGLDAESGASAMTYAAAGWLWVAAALDRRRHPERAWFPARHTSPPVWSRAIPFVAVVAAQVLAFLGGGTAALVSVSLAVSCLAAIRVVQTLTVNAELIAERDRQLVVDELTGAHNRRFFDQEIERAFARAVRSGESLTLIAFDLDHFKRVNDVLGHGAGDALLVSVARRVSADLRLGDVVCRIGGDEFVVIVPEADRASALRLAERVRTAVSAASEHTAPEVPITASIGVAAMPRDASGLRDLMHKADEALYAAKAAGRDRVSAYDPSEMAGIERERALGAPARLP